MLMSTLMLFNEWWMARKSTRNMWHVFAAVRSTYTATHLFINSLKFFFPYFCLPINSLSTSYVGLQRENFFFFHFVCFPRIFRCRIQKWRRNCRIARKHWCSKSASEWQGERFNKKNIKNIPRVERWDMMSDCYWMLDIATIKIHHERL